MKAKFKLDQDTIDDALRQSLAWQYYNLKKDPEMAVFHIDKKKDKKAINKMLKALRRVHNYYSTQEHQIGKDE